MTSAIVCTHIHKTVSDCLTDDIQPRIYIPLFGMLNSWHHQARILHVTCYYKNNLKVFNVLSIYLSFRSCDSCRRLPEPKHHSFLFSHWSSSKCLVFMAARTPSIYVFLGRPLFLLCPGIHSIINFASLSSCNLLTWPYHWSLFLSMMSTMSGFSFTPITSFICSFFILSILDFLADLLSTSISVLLFY